MAVVPYKFNKMFYRLYRRGYQRLLTSALIFVAGFSFGMIYFTYSSRNVPYYTKNIELDQPAHINNSLDAQLNKEVRVLCWIMTNPGNHEIRAQHIRDTWGKRCNILLFMTTADDPSLGNVVNLPVEEGYNNLWNKTKEAFKYVYSKHFDDVDWFLKADDDTYVFVENLRYFLYPYSASDPLYFGYKYRVPQVKDAYMSGGAGYVLSKEALRRLVEEALPDGDKCRQDPTGAEDVELARCLENVNVIAGDSRDHLKGRFFPFRMDYHLRPSLAGDDYWYYINSYYPVHDGLDCCSEFVISFHYVDPNYMYMTEYLVYQMQAVGLQKRTVTLPVKKTFDEVLAELEPYIDRLRSSTTSSTTDMTTEIIDEL